MFLDPNVYLQAPSFNCRVLEYYFCHYLHTFLDSSKQMLDSEYLEILTKQSTEWTVSLWDREFTNRAEACMPGLTFKVLNF